MKNIEKEIKPGIKLHTIKTEKFKTNLIAIFFKYANNKRKCNKKCLNIIYIKKRVNEYANFIRY